MTAKTDHKKIRKNKTESAESPSLPENEPLVEAATPLAAEATSATAAAAAECQGEAVPEVGAEPTIAESPAVEAAASAEDMPVLPAMPEAAVESAEPGAPSEDSIEAAKGKKARKPKLVRDSFTIPEADYALFAELKARCLEQGVAVKKSELLRLGLSLLAELSVTDLAIRAQGVEKIKTGRPAKT